MRCPVTKQKKGRAALVVAVSAITVVATVLVSIFGMRGVANATTSHPNIKKP